MSNFRDFLKQSDRIVVDVVVDDVVDGDVVVDDPPEED